MPDYVQVSRHHVITRTATLVRHTPAGRVRLTTGDGESLLLTPAQLAADWIELTPAVAEANRAAWAAITAGRKAQEDIGRLADLARSPWGFIHDSRDAHYIRLAAFAEEVAALRARLEAAVAG
jgi:hypothetical protein